MTPTNMAVFDSDPCFLKDDSAYSSSPGLATGLGAGLGLTTLLCDWNKVHRDDLSLLSKDENLFDSIWDGCFDLPTPPVSPSHERESSSSLDHLANDELNFGELDLDLADLLGSDDNSDPSQFFPDILSSEADEVLSVDELLASAAILSSMSGSLAGALPHTPDSPFSNVSPLPLLDASTPLTETDDVSPVASSTTHVTVVSTPFATYPASKSSREVGELRHDCMWSGLCPSEEHRREKEAKRVAQSWLVTAEKVALLSATEIQSATNSLDASLTSMSSKSATHSGMNTCSRFHASRPETPSSLSESEYDNDDDSASQNLDRRSKQQRSQPSCRLGVSSSSELDLDDEDDDDDEDEEDEDDEEEEAHCDSNARIGMKVESEEDEVDGSECAGDDSPFLHPGNVQLALRTPNKHVTTQHNTVLPDHSYYSHSDHSYHSVKRPGKVATEHLGIQTPSDSEEEIDVVSLGKPSHAYLTARPPFVLQHPKNEAAKVAHNPFLVRKMLPANPSTLVRKQLQLAVASAAHQKKSNVSGITTSATESRFVKMGAGATTTVVRRINSDSHEAKSSHSSTGSKRVSESATSTTTNHARSVGRPPKRARMSTPTMASLVPDHMSSSEPSSPRKKQSSRAGSDSEDGMPGEKRNMHNSMERQRRVDLRNAFDHLRALLPDLSSDRAAKVVILKKAAAHCHNLTVNEQRLLAEKESLLKKQEQLRKKLELVQRRR